MFINAKKVCKFWKMFMNSKVTQVIEKKFMHFEKENKFIYLPPNKVEKIDTISFIHVQEKIKFKK